MPIMTTPAPNPKLAALEAEAMKYLATVMDPELNVDIVSLGLVYNVAARVKPTGEADGYFLHILLTLTTPGCPLAAVFEPMIKQALTPIEDIDSEQDVTIELTFDPPWVPDMMSDEAKAELGFD
jgi:metal-sulfur cluster biosynthetic enzyme